MQEMLLKKFNLNLISKFRSELMGLSALGIIACHASPNGVYLPSPLYQIAAFGQLGVIVFFLLSGLGMSYSLDKHKGSMWLWYAKRFKRLFIPYTMLALPFFVYRTYATGGSFIDFILSFSTMDYWIRPTNEVWFIAILIPFYIITPPLQCACVKNKSNILISLLLICIIITMVVLGQTFQYYQSALNQGLFYFVGFWLAKYVKKRKSINGYAILLASLFVCCVFTVVPQLRNIPRLWMLLPPFIIFSCICFEMMRKYNCCLVKGGCIFMGKISLESYLTNIFFGSFFDSKNYLFVGLFHDEKISHYAQYLCVIKFGVGLASLVHYVVSHCSLTNRLTLI